MKKTVNFLMATIILLPIAAYFLGTPPTDTQLNIIKKPLGFCLQLLPSRL
jgi:hypothetical protein